MSEGKRLALAQAKGIAERAVAALRPGAARIEIAGSIRRGRPDVGDIEIVAIPRFRREPIDLFGERLVKVSELDELVSGPDWETVKGADRYRQLVFLGKYKIDLFIQPDPATWGVNLALRTGSGDFSKWLVTRRKQGGALPNDMYVRESRLWHEGRGYPVDTSEEHDFFREIGLAWIEPEERIVGHWWQAEKLGPSGTVETPATASRLLRDCGPSQ